MQTREYTCVRCPVGCAISVELDDEGEVVAVSGNTCPQGEEYGREEATCPMRTLTALVDVEGSSMPLSCKTVAPVPKALIFDCLAALRELSLTPPVLLGDVILHNICGTGVDVVATKDCA